jgi:hypothetical protein
MPLCCGRRQTAPIRRSVQAGGGIKPGGSVYIQEAHAEAERSGRRARAQTRLPTKVRQQLLNGIYAGTPFRTVVRDLGLTSQQVWGLTKTDQGWSTALEAALTAARRDDLEHGTNAAYVHGCVCRDCREHQQRRMGRNRGS